MYKEMSMRMKNSVVFALQCIQQNQLRHKNSLLKASSFLVPEAWQYINSHDMYIHTK